MENFKPQSWKIKLEKWHGPSNKSEISGFYKEKNSKFTGSFNPHISATVCFVVDGVAKLVFVSIVIEADYSPAPTL